jgi:translation elongation factor P/translation initiation factor 5A
MISVTELRTGTTFLLDGQPHQVLEYKHSKIGRGTANILLLELK